MTASSETGRVRTTAILQIATGIGIVAFWVLFFTVGLAPADPPPCYFPFEHSFPPPDLALAAALLASGWNLLNSGSWGRTVSLVCAGGLLFLGIIDMSFTVQRGGLKGPLHELQGTIVITVRSIGLGIWMVNVHHGATSHDPLAQSRD